MILSRKLSSYNRTGSNEISLFDLMGKTIFSKKKILQILQIPKKLKKNLIFKSKNDKIADKSHSYKILFLVRI